MSPMARVVLVRAGWLVVTLFVISILVFAATQALPGDPAKAILGQTATPERTAILREQLGLNEPVVRQYLSWLGGVLHGDLGTSAINGASVSSLIGARVANSFVLMLAVSVVAVPISIALALVAAVARAAGSTGW